MVYRIPEIFIKGCFSRDAMGAVAEPAGVKIFIRGEADAGDGFIWNHQERVCQDNADGGFDVAEEGKQFCLFLYRPDVFVSGAWADRGSFCQ